jgi:hypothetical protein
MCQVAIGGQKPTAFCQDRIEGALHSISFFQTQQGEWVEVLGLVSLSLSLSLALLRN